MRQGRPSFPFFFHQFWLCKFVACHRLPCKHIRHFQPCLQTWRVLLTQVDLFCKHGQNGLVCHRICTSCFSQGMSLCGGMVHHSSYIYHRLLGSCCDCVTRSECVTPGDFDGAVWGSFLVKLCRVYGLIVILQLLCLYFVSFCSVLILNSTSFHEAR